MKSKDMFFRLNQGETLKVILKKDQLDFTDTQYVELYKKGDYYRIDNKDGENILCVDDKDYIKSIVSEVIGGSIIK